MTARVLIVEDEAHLADGLRFNLEAEGYHVETVGDGETALRLLLAKQRSFDAIILDVMLPGKNGFEVAAELRRAGRFTPVLMLTARSRPEDVLRGFESGADDYLPKPFELAILTARLGGLLRRREWLHRDQATSLAAAATSAKELGMTVKSREEEEEAPLAGARTTAVRHGAPHDDGQNELFVFDGKTIDFSALELRVAGRNIVRLTLMEAELLRYLIRHVGRVVSRKAMLEEVWNLHEDTDTRAIDNFIVRLRKYIEDEPSKPKYLLTIRGVGYRFVTDLVAGEQGA